MNDKIGIEPDIFLKDYYKMVYKIASKYSTKSYYKDIIQEGMVGLMEAYHTFDPSLNNKFSSCAYKYISGRMSHYYRDKVELIKKPRLYSKIKVLVNEKGYRIEDADIIAEILNCSVKHVKDVIFILQNGKVVHADKDTKDDEEKETVFNKLIGNDCDYTENIVEEFLDKLSGNTLKVIELSMQGYSRVEIANMMGFSQPMASKYAKKAQKAWIEYIEEEL